MSTAGLAITILCSCGQPEEHPVHSGGGHQYVPQHIAEYLRPTQKYKRGYNDQRYSLRESRIIKLAAPAVGVDVKATVPGAAKWWLWSLRATLATDAVVANRIPHLQITDGPNGNIVADFPAANNQGAGTTIAYAAGAGVVAANFDSTIVFVLPVEVELLQGWTIGFKTTGLDVGDQWSALALLVTETLYY